MPSTSTKPTGNLLVDERHAEWQEHHTRWRFLLDSYEGGDSYRYATYGVDARGIPKRNLVRHKLEYPQDREAGAFVAPRTDPSQATTDDDYSLRLVRTPVPTFVSEAVQIHLSKIFAAEVKRDTPSRAIEEWWKDVNGLGTSMDDWAAEVFAPLLMVLGCLDIVADHPPAPSGVAITTMADQRIYRLDRCVVGVILPENMVNWRMSPDGRHYAECVVCELQDDGETQWHRYWDAESWTLYDDEGAVVRTGTHSYGRPPIVRVFDRKRPRCKNVGIPRYEGIAEKAKEYYNRDSELILSDSVQAHPLLQGPEDYIQADGTLPVGPSWLLPKKKNLSGSSVSYEPFEVLDFPKGAAESIRQNMAHLRDEIDRDACLTKPAGAAGTDGSTVSQSGVSKRIDSSAGNDLLGKIAARLQDGEKKILEIVSLVLGNGTIDEALLEETKVNYSRAFDLMSADEFTKAYVEYQSLLANAGPCPDTEAVLMGRLVRLMLPGLDDDDYTVIDKEHAVYLKKKAAEHKAAQEADKAMAEAMLKGQQQAVDQAANGTPDDANGMPVNGAQPVPA